MGKAIWAAVVVAATAALPVAAQGASSRGQAAATASVSAYPSRPIRIIIPFTAGSATDILARPD